MFPVQSIITYRLWNATTQKYIYIGNEDCLIRYLASTWKKEYFYPLTQACKNRKYWNDEWYSSTFFEQCACNYKDKGYKIYQIFDNNGRIIQPLDYQDISFQYFQQGKTLKKRRLYFYRSYKYKYRYDPVPNTRGFRRGGPPQKMQKTKHIFLLFDDPVYKDEFKRGSKKLVPSWWDEKFKKRDIRNWKHQSKCRHQWQRGKKDQWLGQ